MVNMAGEFKYKDCLMKHYVRTKGWLPLCKERQKKINSGRVESKKRRLRYFTFCAIEAIDVLMLDVAKVVRQSEEGRFDTVYFFQRETEDILETQKRIPGSNGIPGDFVSTVLLSDAEEEMTLKEEEQEDTLVSPEEEPDTGETHSKMLRRSARQQLIKGCPFDVINLDLEGYLFRSKDQIPGNLIRAIRKLLYWQAERTVKLGRHEENIDEFTLFFTTKIGPDDLSEEYLDMISAAINSNIRGNEELAQILLNRTGCRTGEELKEKDFTNMFLIGAPKLLATVLSEEDWFVDPEFGIQIYKFERDHDGGQYSMVHLVMNVKRKKPPKQNRAPGSDPIEAADAYKKVVKNLFEKKEIQITKNSEGMNELKPSLETIKSRRKKYFPGDID
jgi:hypothetical protein